MKRIEITDNVLTITISGVCSLMISHAIHDPERKFEIFDKTKKEDAEVSSKK
jgi:hypothetical protein